MASDQGQAQARRRENTTTEREIHYVEKERVPKMASHFDSLVDRARDSEIETGGRVGTNTPHGNRANIVGDAAGAGKAREIHGLGGASAAGKDQRPDIMPNVSAVGKFQIENRPGDQNQPSGNFAQVARGNQSRNGSTTTEQPPSNQLGLGDISQLRGQAQQQSMEAINAAEQRYNYNKARESAIQGLNAASEQAKRQPQHTHNNQGERATATAGIGHPEQGTQQAHDVGYTGRGARNQGTQSAQQKTGNQAKNSTHYVEKQGTQSATKKGTRANEGAQYAEGLNAASEYAKEKGTQAKDTLFQGAQYATEKGTQAKDTVVEGAQKAPEYLSEKTGEATESLANAGKTSMGYTQQATNYTWEKAVGAKDTLVDVGKNVASYAGEKMVAAKDRVPAVGWSAAHYTTEKAVEGTKIAAQVVQGAGQKVVEVAAKPLMNVAKDAAAVTGETLREYTARKKEEAQRELEAKQSAEQYEQGNEGGEEVEYIYQQHGNRGATNRKMSNVDAEQPYRNRGVERGEFGEKQKQGSGTTQQKMRDVNFEQQRSPAQPHVDVQQMSRESQQFQGQEDQMQSGGGGGGGGVLNAIGETIVEIAQTTKNMVIGQDKDEDRANCGSQSSQMQGNEGRR